MHDVAVSDLPKRHRLVDPDMSADVDDDLPGWPAFVS